MTAAWLQVQVCIVKITGAKAGNFRGERGTLVFSALSAVKTQWQVTT